MARMNGGWLGLGLGFVIAWASASASVSATAQERPNVVFILADDLGVNDLGCYGRTEHATPQIDRIAREGARFTTAYAACSICSPSRAAILTGKAPARLHVTTFLPGRADATSQKVLHPSISEQLPLAETTLAEALRADGYATACIGKWHLGGAGFGPGKQGFETVHPGRAATTPGALEGGKGELDLARAAAQFLERNADRPFFLYLAHHSPHIPLAARADRIEAYAHKEAFNPKYAAMMETLDESVGLVLKKLDDLKLTNRTIVVFTSDNGGLHVPELNDDPPTHNTPYRAGKGFQYDGGLRVPALIRWPGVVAAGRTIDPPFIGTDWMPTLLEACGVAAPNGLDGRSRAGILRNQPPEARPLYWHVPHYTNQGGRPSGAIRILDWKLIERYDGDPPELYDLAADPGETRNLADREPERVAAMLRALRDWRKSVGAQENTPNPDFDEAEFQAIYRETDVSKLRPSATAAETAAPLRSWRRRIDAAVSKKR